MDQWTLADNVDAPSELEWRVRARAARPRYLAANPWPHLVEHDLLPRSLVLAAEEQELPAALVLPTRGTHRERKADARDVAGPAAEQLLAMLKSPAFLAYLEELTGIGNLQTDPTNQWAGLHANGPDAFRSVHTDFVVHPVTQKWHRVNVLLFLNSDWHDDYGGDLELWAPDLSECGARVKPEAGTMVIFETHGGTPHGIPDPVACPEGRMRLSLVAYFYSDDPPADQGARHRLRLERRPQDPWSTSLPEFNDLGHLLIGPLTRRFPALRRVVNRVRGHRG